MANLSGDFSPVGATAEQWDIKTGKMTENKGSAGAMTANGTIILAAASAWS